MSDQAISTRGGGFLIADIEPAEVFVPERFDESTRLISQTVDEFIEREVHPQVDAIEGGDHELTRSLMRRAGEVGLLGADIPEAYGGSGLGKVASTLITERMAMTGSFAVSFGAHTGIGTLPLVFYGDESQKQRYLPDLASGARLAAYALTEPEAGSDAMGIRTTARRESETYRLSGQKQWITNSGFADLFVVYAKVDGEQMAAFLVERGFDGLSVGPEFEKMGLHGSSTCSVYFDNVPVPASNVLGEIGRGHVLAFNMLNIGRWKLAAGCLGSCKAALRSAAGHAVERRQFGHRIADFPAIQQKLAAMSSRIFALESMVYRTAGLFDQRLNAEDGGGNHSDHDQASAIREYAVEASINKIFGSETLDFVVDEAVQIHGGMGYMRGVEIERGYRDARINRIFEGTNEINRLLIPATLLRRATRGELPLMDAIQRVQGELSSLRPAGFGTTSSSDGLATDRAALANLKRAALMVAGVGAQKYATHPEAEQEFLLAVADLAVLTFAWESALLRARQVADTGVGDADAAKDLVRLFGEHACDQAEILTRRALAGMEEGDALQAQLAVVRRLFRRTPLNTVQIGRRVAERVLDQPGLAGG